MRLRPHSWLWALGAAGLVCAARLREIHRHTGDVALNDQWKIEAADLLGPWLDGTLQPTAFFAPHFEHVPMWTRLLAWLQVVFTGRWDPLVQASVNTLLYGAFIALVVRWLTGHLRPLTALGVSLFLVAGSALPHAWENITWGFQSQFPLALLFLFLHVHGSFVHPAGHRGWWWAQAAGVAGLFTLAGMWIAPLAVVLASLWIQPRSPRLQLLPLATTAAGLGLIAVIRATAPAHGAFAQTAGSPLHFLHALLDLLGWPAGWPGAFLLLNIPLVVFALQLRGRTDATPFDRTVLALGLWATGQAAALAFARSADYGGYVSRYGELLFILVLANALALVRLPPARSALLTRVFASWFGLALAGWWALSTGGHTAYFHAHSAPNAQIRREAVQAYLQHGDRHLLERQETRWVLYQDVNQITRLLDQPRFRDLLPVSVHPANPPDPVGTFARFVQRHTNLLGTAAALALLAGFVRSVRAPLPGCTPLPSLALRPDPVLLPFTAVVAAAATALLFCWPAPFVFGSVARWPLTFSPAGSIGPLELRVVQGSANEPPKRLIGAAPLSPTQLRMQFSGTHPEGPGLTCTAWSKAFPLHQPWLVIPFAGYPVAHGNGLRLRIEETDGTFLTEVACSGPNQAAPAFWTADVRPYTGKQARLVLYDGRTDTEGWVAAAPPIATDDPALADRLQRRLPRESLIDLHFALGLTALLSTLAALGLGWSAWRRPVRK